MEIFGNFTLCVEKKPFEIRILLEPRLKGPIFLLEWLQVSRHEAQVPCTLPCVSAPESRNGICVFVQQLAGTRAPWAGSGGV